MDDRKPSPRQQRVIELVAIGLKNREIAKELGIGEKVVRNYLGIIYDDGRPSPASQKENRLTAELQF